MTPPTGFAVAIDGPVGVGKSTVAKKLARELHMTYIDTGAMYRAVALYNMRKGNDPRDKPLIVASLPHIDIQLQPNGGITLNGEDITGQIRSQHLAEFTSTIATISAVREKLTQQQKQLAAHAQVVMDGRDIGSQVLPWAQVKIYLDADVKIRARRRCDELQAKGIPADFTRIWEETLIRDERDKNRKHAPLTQTADAHYIDASFLTPNEICAQIAAYILKAKSY